MESEAEAIDALRLGDQRGLGPLLNRYQHRSVGIAFTITGELESARDAVSDSFERLPGVIRLYDPARPFAPWFFRIVTRQAITIAKRQSRFVTGPQAEDVLSSRRAGEDEDPEALAEKRELGRLLASVLAELSPEDRAVIALRYYSDLTERDVAAVVGSTVQAVHIRLSRARRRFRDLLCRRKEFEHYLEGEQDDE
jgi:RNA polymerase sigma-70 factor (ECF subfamily)